MEHANYGSKNRTGQQPGQADLLLSLTRRCNLNCPYCFLDRTREPADLPAGTMARALGLLFSSSKRTVSLQLFGGEPALVPGLLSRTISCARRMEKRTGKRLKISLTTNLLGWRDDALRLLAREGVSVIASLDGDETAQQWRSGIPLPRAAFARMLAAALRLKQLGCRLRLNMVVAPEKVASFRRNLSFLKALELGEIQAAYALKPGWTASRRRSFIKQLLDAGREERHRQDLAVEPVLTHPQVFCDCCGTISVGCAAVIETSAPALAEAFKRGTVSDFTSIDQLTGSREEQEKKITLLLSKKALPPFIREVLAIGRALKKLGKGQHI